MSCRGGESYAPCHENACFAGCVRLPDSGFYSACPSRADAGDNGRYRMVTLAGRQVMGEVAAVAVDASDHVWVLHRPGSIAGANRTRAAPPGGARPPSPAPEDAGNATLGYFMVG